MENCHSTEEDCHAFQERNLEVRLFAVSGVEVEGDWAGIFVGPTRLPGTENHGVGDIKFGVLFASSCIESSKASWVA